MSSNFTLPTNPSLLIAPKSPYIDRDLSWLQFNERVLKEAQQRDNPLLERLKFLAISSSNLDEFFMIRLASLGRSIQTINRNDPSSAQHLMRIRTNILKKVRRFVVRQNHIFSILREELETEKVHIIQKSKYTGTIAKIGKKIFDEQILPVLTIPELYSSKKLTALENLQLCAIFKDGFWFRIPKNLPWVFSATDQDSSAQYFFLLDDLLSQHLGNACRLRGAPSLIRLTRDCDFSVEIEEEDTESIPDIIRSGLGSRDKGKPVRLQYSGNMIQGLIAEVLTSLKLAPEQAFFTPSSLGLHSLWGVVHHFADQAKENPNLQYSALKSITPRPFLTPERIFEELKKKDILLHHPYDSFDAYVEWIKTACADPHVAMIEQTVYRMDAMSHVMNALKTAAKSKKIKVVIELRARFDELNNLTLADELRKAGVEVAFGFGKLKLHAKVTLVTRREADGIKLYTHLSTGNYNAKTARQYTDLAVLTSNQEIGSDVSVFFDSVFRGEVPTQFKHLVSAPTKLHRKLLSLIQTEERAALKGEKARIVAKVNALVDRIVIEHLYRASQAGVQIDLIVRGACSLIPGIKGLSENIRVISIVDRFLEHSRIYHFYHSKIMYLSSADWMPRNFFSRLELAFPVLDPNLFRYLEEVLIPTYLKDTAKARELTPYGIWRKRTFLSNTTHEKEVRSQFFFAELAEKAYDGTPLV